MYYPPPSRPPSGLVFSFEWYRLYSRELVLEFEIFSRGSGLNQCFSQKHKKSTGSTSYINSMPGVFAQFDANRRGNKGLRSSRTQKVKASHGWGGGIRACSVTLDLSNTSREGERGRKEREYYYRNECKYLSIDPKFVELTADVLEILF